MTTCSGDYRGEAIVPASRAGHFLEQSGNCPYSNGDLYELAWKGGGITISPCSRRPEVWHVPPSEDDMVTWLYPIITGGGEGHVGDDDVASQSQRTDDRVVTSKDTDNKLSKDKREENNTATETSDSIARRNGSPRGPRSDYTGSHRQREKKRRSKINKNLKTLQRLVPGCDKRCSQASILDLTILCIKSLQRQFQAMSVAVGGSITPAAAVSPVPAVASAPGVVQVRPGLVLGAAPPVIPFAPMVPTVMMHSPLVCRATPSVVGHGGCRHGTGTNRCKKISLRRDSEVVNQGATMRWDQHLDDAWGGIPDMPIADFELSPSAIKREDQQ